jgi:hypothetical protein
MSVEVQSMKIASCFTILFVFVAALLFLASPVFAKKGESKTMHTVEIRSYNLKPGTRARFHQVATEQAIPMLRRAKIDVVALGPSLHDENSHFLIRAFPSVEERQKQEDSFYDSEEWKQGPRQAILDCIESYTTVVIQVDDAGLASLRKAVYAPKP